jgi:hypothetical protein
MLEHKKIHQAFSVFKSKAGRLGKTLNGHDLGCDVFLE